MSRTARTTAAVALALLAFAGPVRAQNAPGSATTDKWGTVGGWGGWVIEQSGKRGERGSGTSVFAARTPAWLEKDTEPLMELVGPVRRGGLALLGAKRSETCPSLTISGRDIPTATGAIVSTRLSPNRCRDFAFDLAWLGDGTPRYSRHDRAARLDDGARSALKGAMPPHWSAFASACSRSRYTHAKAPPRAYALELPGAAAVLTEHAFAGKVKWKSYLLSVGGQVRPLHRSARLLGAFSIEERLFLHFEFADPDSCRPPGQFILEVTPKGVREIMYEEIGAA